MIYSVLYTSTHIYIDMIYNDIYNDMIYNDIYNDMIYNDIYNDMISHCSSVDNHFLTVYSGGSLYLAICSLLIIYSM